ncbi:pilus assembly protein [Paenibacillus sp. 1011MAR3C5]|uniref:TadE/TadG family type IV pilus assembly protein n=1 Tax=Paenibacillus sp. 1011MAR3C5 TaxID=1675787 RepID=UPI000E6D3109|nr:TadE family protein [Paenibacillus sp. 1011MAR3C5]RJE91270.1 pilus assembly protein [Paenibacillus sp. 1011MAR3C5]
MKPNKSLTVKSRFRKWHKEEKGSFTLEASIVLPILLAMVLSFLLLGMYLYQKVIVFYSVSAISERAAFSWDNSYRDARTGILTKPVYDSLYRRLGSDGALASLFGLTGDESRRSVSLPEEIQESIDSENSDLTKRKLANSAQWLATAGLGYNGTVQYAGDGISRYVETSLRKPIRLMPFESSWIRGEPDGEAKSRIVDPVEFIRSVDLARYYSAKLKTHFMGKSTAESRAGDILHSYGSKGKGGT